MKIQGGMLEINGIERVVFYKKNAFLRVVTPKGNTYWFDAVRAKTLDNETMCEIIKNATHNLTRKVWVHGNSINVDRVSKKRMKQVKLLEQYLTEAAAEIHLPLS
jgi:uncharacterized protein (UPF0276 family)